MNFLKQMRNNSGLTLREMCCLTGISNPYLSQLERMVLPNPSALVIHKLAAHYHYTYEEMMMLMGWKPELDSVVIDNTVGSETVRSED